MKAISLWQPWASLWLSPAKLHETRHWAAGYRGWLAVHAAKRFEKDHYGALADILRREFGPRWYRELPTGALIGAVQLEACLKTDSVYHPDAQHLDDDYRCGDFSPGRFAWRRGAYCFLEKPIPYVGRQGLFEIGGAAAEQIAALRQREAA